MSKTTTRAGEERAPGIRMLTDPAYQLWLASLGALAQAGQQGSRAFDHLVSLGERIERGARETAYARVRATQDQAAALSDAAFDAWIALGRSVQARITALLHRFQIPTAGDVHELNRRVEALQAAVEALASEKAARPAKPRRAAPRKASGRATPARRSASRQASGARKAG